MTSVLTAFCRLAPALSAAPWRMTSVWGMATALLFGCACPGARAAASVDDLTGPWQLLVDDYPVLSKTNVTRTYHAFQKYEGNPVLVAEYPWEDLVYLYGTVLPNETRTGYRMWYHTLRPDDANNDGSLELYATSTDGIHWTKPILNLRSWHGSTANNMFFTRPTAGGMTSVMHTPWEPDPVQRYKLMNFDSGGFYGAWSSNGINIVDAPNNPVFTGGSDVGQFCWDPHTQLYRGYVKNSWYDWNGLRRRAVALTTTTNIGYWPRESLILWPDAFDDRWIIPGSVQRTHFYGLSAFPYESMYIGFLWIFRATELDGEMPGYLIGPCFVELVSSHDGVRWTRQEGARPPILPLGPAGSWDDGMVFTARAPIVEGDAIKLWYGGFDQVHGMSLKTTTGSIGLATLRKDGFASLDAGATTGTILTKPLTGASGALQVNYRAVSGSLRVEVLDENYGVIPGYGQADCVALTGDGITQTVTWAAHATLPAGASTLHLRFLLQNASLYSFMAGPSAALVDVPTITQQPANQTAFPGGSASFTVVASAISPLSYQWQKNQLIMSDGGHYSGCTTATLTIANADSSDAAAYRCLVTNTYGSVISSSATLVVASNAFGPVTLIPIPTLTGDSSNEGRAMTQDGRYVVGLSGASNGFFYDSVSKRVVRPVSSDGAAAQTVTGVAYRTNSSTQQEIVLSGISAGWFTTWMTTNIGLTWGPRISAAPIKNTVVPVANGLAGASSGVFYSVWMDEGPNTIHDNWSMYVNRFAGTWPMTPAVSSKGFARPETAALNSICGKGRAVGWQKSTAASPSLNYIADYNGAGSTLVRWNVYGLDGTTKGEAFSVSADGSAVFGMSPVVAGAVTNHYSYKAVFDTTFPGPATQLSTNRLPNLPDTAGSATLAIPYGCSADGQYAVGVDYRSGIEKAVLWNTRDASPTNWTVTDLTDVAVASGAQGTFARLARAYSMATNAAGNLVITGVGLDTNNPARTRAFLMTQGQPATPVVTAPTLTISGSYPGGFTFSFPTVADASVVYYLECTPNLPPVAGWTTIASTPGTGALAGLADPNAPERQCFYRVRIQ